MSNSGACVTLLELLFPAVPSAALSAGYLGRRPLLARGPLDRLAAVLRNMQLRGPADVERLAVGYSQPVRAAVANAEGVLGYELLDGAARRRLAAAPCRVYLFDRLDDHFTAARELVRGLCDALAAPLDTAKATGFFETMGAGVPRHCDDPDVFIVQVFGHKRWRIEANTDPPSGVYDPVRVAPDGGAGEPAFGPTTETLELDPGSVLYLPRAYWHETRSLGSSFSVTVGLLRR